MSGEGDAERTLRRKGILAIGLWGEDEGTDRQPRHSHPLSCMSQLARQPFAESIIRVN